MQSGERIVNWIYRGRRPAVVVSTVLWVLGAVIATASISADTGYQAPPQEIVDLLDAPITPAVSFGPNPDLAVLLERRSLTSLAELSETELRLAGMRIKPDINGPSRQRPVHRVQVLDVKTGDVVDVEGMPENPRLIYSLWSPDGRHLSVCNIVENGIELWVVDVQERKARRLLGPTLNLTSRIPPAWLDNEHLIATVIPEDRGSAPKESRIPQTPTVQENRGGKAAARTYQDLLKNNHDEKLFEFYFTSTPVSVSLSGEVKQVAEPALYWNIDPSPDGQWILAQIIHRPYSYLVPASRFPLRSEIWNRAGEVVHQVYDRPLAESVPIARGSVITGPRQMSWRADAPASLVWVEALDEGDAAKKVELRDEVFLQAAPFDQKPISLVRLAYRYGGIRWANDDLAIADSWWWQTRMQRSWRVRPGSPDEEPVLMKERSWEDRYSDPGSPMMKTNEYGRRQVRTTDDGKAIFLAGAGASPEGNRPFLDRYDLESGETTRLFRSEAPYFESPFRVLDNKGERILTRRESTDEVPNYYIRDLKKGTLKSLTSFPHPTPQLKGIEKELVRYTREDGVELSATLYLPPGHDVEKDGPLPMLMWAYPREFKNAAAAGQVDSSPYRFNRVEWWSQLLWLTQGYALLDDPKMPIVGEGEEEPNDTFREQLVASAKAAVDEMVRRGVAKPGHIAVGGHSYGAFMTAHLLAHSDLFATGIARSGAYNRTLTPFGFQNEQRTLWEAPEIYAQISPFMHAHKINEPILLIHGEADNNPGTFPMQSERFYNALKGHGAEARLVTLPLESHGYRARESIMHVLWETHRWLEAHIAMDQVDEESMAKAAGGP